MKNTIDAIKYGLETLDITPKKMFSLIESSRGYDGDDYDRWLVQEIIKIADKDGVGYSKLLAKWFNIIQSIIEEYADKSLKPCFENKILEMVKNNKVYTIGIPDENNSYGIELKDIDWGSKVDLPYNYDFIETLPEELKEDIENDKGVSIFVKFNPKGTFKKSADLVIDAKRNGVSIKSYDAMLMYRMCTIVKALDDLCSNFKFVFMTDTKFLYNPENAEVINYFLSYFNYKGFVVNSKDIYSGSFTSEEYAICECTPRGINDEEQDGFVLSKGTESDGEFVLKDKKKRYSRGYDMLTALLNEYPLSMYTDNVPMIDTDFKVVGVCKGLKKAYGYMCKTSTSRNPVLTSYPLKDSKYIAITDDNMMKIISYYGVTQSMENSGMFIGIDEIMDGHPEFQNLVSNCVPVFLFDICTKFCDLGVVKNKSGKDVRLSNKMDIISSEVVSKLIDRSTVYFSYEAKELMGICKGFLDYFEENSDESMVGKTFEEIRRQCNNSDLNSAYLNALSRCKDFIGSLYRQVNN